MTNLTPRDIADLKKEILSALRCALPGIVESFDPETQTASVRPALRKGSFPLPVIRDVPVFFPGSRDSAITWPISEGDGCLLVFADCDMDALTVLVEKDGPAAARTRWKASASGWVSSPAGNCPCSRRTLCSPAPARRGRRDLPRLCISRPAGPLTSAFPRYPGTR